MPNDLYKQMGANMGANDNGFMDFVEKFNQFRSQFTGDPKAEIGKLLQSGKISQAQLDQVQQMAQRMIALMPRR